MQKPLSAHTCGFVSSLALRGNDSVRFANLTLKNGDHLIDDEIADIGRIAIAAENLVAGNDQATRHDDEQVAKVLW
jgi:hypothetical protein